MLCNSSNNIQGALNVSWTHALLYALYMPPQEKPIQQHGYYSHSTDEETGLRGRKSAPSPAARTCRCWDQYLGCPPAGRLLSNPALIETFHPSTWVFPRKDACGLRLLWDNSYKVNWHKIQRTERYKKLFDIPKMHCMGWWEYLDDKPSDNQREPR